MYSRNDQGCFGDGAHGHQHIRLVLADLLADAGAPLDYIKPLENEMSDDASEEDDALEWLNDNVCDGVAFGFADGDLLLLSHAGWEDRAE